LKKPSWTRSSPSQYQRARWSADPANLVRIEPALTLTLWTDPPVGELLPQGPHQGWKGLQLGLEVGDGIGRPRLPGRRHPCLAADDDADYKLGGDGRLRDLRGAVAQPPLPFEQPVRAPLVGVRLVEHAAVVRPSRHFLLHEGLLGTGDV
jgi:hypothetical protein